MSLRAFSPWVTTAALIAVLAGCGEPAASSTPNGTPPPESTAESAPPEATTTSAVPEPASGPLLATCAGTGVSLSTLDLSTGTTTPIATFSATVSSIGATSGPSTTWSVCDSGTLSSYLARQVFSPDLDRIAVNVRDTTNDSGHVGWIDAASGELNDVTALLTDVGGYSAQPQHSNALFDGDGNFGYFDGAASEYVFIDPGTRAKVRSQKMPTPGLTMFLMPDGSVSDDSRGLDRGMVLTIPMPTGGVLDSSSYSPVVWIIDKSRGLQISEPISGPNTLGVKAAGPDDPATEGEATPITPLTDYVIQSAVSDPKATTAVFTASRGQTLDTFQVPLDGSTQPSKIGTLEQQPGESITLIGWE